RGFGQAAGGPLHAEKDRLVLPREIPRLRGVAHALIPDQRGWPDIPAGLFCQIFQLRPATNIAKKVAMPPRLYSSKPTLKNRSSDFQGIGLVIFILMTSSVRLITKRISPNAIRRIANDTCILPFLQRKIPEIPSENAVGIIHLLALGLLHRHCAEHLGELLLHFLFRDFYCGGFCRGTRNVRVVLETVDDQGIRNFSRDIVLP